MNTRIFVKKKDAFKVESDFLLDDIRTHLKLLNTNTLERYNVYDVFNCNQEDIKLLKQFVLSECVSDLVCENLKFEEGKYIAYEYVSGQYDQRGDSAQQCLMLLNDKDDVVIRSATCLVFKDAISKEDKAKIAQYLINPVEMQNKDMTILEFKQDIEIAPLKDVAGFLQADNKQLKKMREEYGLAMTLEDLACIQEYFINEEKRELRESELKVLDTYWSDHCRHTTFETILNNVIIREGTLKSDIQKAFEEYIQLREELYQGKRAMTLMDIATIGGKSLKKAGYLNDLEESDEINACSIEISVDVNGKDEEYLLMFKNETHNHPTEIEPFGGAATCIGGAIRDPLSGRSYVYQAMRISGAADVLTPLSETLKNKLPQAKISRKAAAGYSSYGNQIGLATTYVKELYHPGYVAKRMEVGAVVGATPKCDVTRAKPAVNDIILLLGGATGRDGIGGATGSSKEHSDQSLHTCGSEVQKGNPITERKIQRLFEHPVASKMIKKANDFGAGGVCVAIGELADGLIINLDKVPVKYLGLSALELAISESQERMAVLIDPKDEEAFTKLAYEENLAVSNVAIVSKDQRLIMRYNNIDVVNLSRAFIDTNGVRSCQDIEINTSVGKDIFEASINNMCDNLQQQNVASQIGLVEMFDASIGKSTVLMPYGGKYQASEEEGSVQKIPVKGFTNTCSMMTYGYNPQISEASPYLGGAYSVVEALTRIVALGGDYRTCRMSNQEYFERLQKDPLKWGAPMQALLGNLQAQMAFKVPAIGGKDSMSGTFNELHVPPTLMSFAITSQHTDKIISAAFKQSGENIYILKHHRLDKELPNYEQLKSNYEYYYELVKNNKISSATTVKFGGISACLAKMSFGNRIGIEVKTALPLFTSDIGSIVFTSKEKLDNPNLECIGVTKNSNLLKVNEESVTISEAFEAYTKRYDKLYPRFSNQEIIYQDIPLYERKDRIKVKQYIEYPKVVIPLFPGQNCEKDTAEQFKRAGGDVEIVIFNNSNVESIKKSIEVLSEKIGDAQIVALIGGFSSGDEPDGSAKFVANVLRNKLVAKGIKKLLDNDGLILGICNGFQALIKSGLLPYGEVRELNKNDATLFRNDISRHVSRMYQTRVTSNKSPWLASFKVNDVHNLAFSHGEGKMIVSEEQFKKWSDNGQVATQYVDYEGNVTSDPSLSPNGSFYSIEGLTSMDGRIFGKMGHSERYEDGIMQNISGNKNQNIFENGISYFKRKEGE